MILTLASMENPLFSRASMAAAAASSRRLSLNQRITRRRTRSVSAARCGRGGGLGDTFRSAQQSLNLIKKDLRQGVNSRGPISEHAAQSLKDGDHPVPHGHRWNHVIDKMRCGLGHVPTVAGRAHAAGPLCGRRRLRVGNPVTAATMGGPAGGRR